MASMDKRHVYFAPADGDGGTGGGTGGAVEPFADAAAARGFLKDYVPGEDFLTPFKDEQVLPFAKHLKGKIDGFGGQFPEKWRQLVAGENADHLKTLERFQSPKALYESYASLRAKMASGEMKEITPFPEKGDDAAKSAWRASNGVPATHEEYVKALKLPDGVVVGDDDKPVIEGFAKAAHAANLPQGAVNATAAWFLQEQSNRAAKRAEDEANHRAASEDALRAEWGADYRGNIARINGLLDSAPKGVKEAISNGRAMDGSALANNTAVLNWLVGLSRETNPAGVVLPGADGSMGQGVEDEIASIEKVMRENRTAYNKDEKMQARLRLLYEAREKHGGGAKAA